jgi:hypothetical protein
MIAASTIGMTVYNLLTQQYKLNADDLFTLSKRALGVDIEREDFDEAIKGTLQRKFVVADGNDYVCGDTHRRPVRWRNRDGDGWDGWRVADLKTPYQSVSLESQVEKG